VIRYFAYPDFRRMVVRRAVSAGIITSIGCHTFRATGVTVYLLNGGAVGICSADGGA
jgi:integrase/recombinase XerD